MIWSPKYKILELIELIVIKIKERKTQERIIQKYAIGHVFNVLGSPMVILCLAVLLRVLVGLGSYSGRGEWPNLGDF